MIIANPTFQSYEQTDRGSRTLMVSPKGDGLVISIAEWDAIDDSPPVDDLNTGVTTLRPARVEVSSSPREEQAIKLSRDTARELYKWLGRRLFNPTPQL